MRYRELNAKYRKARKPRRCCGCHAIIKAGESYYSITGVDDGDFIYTALCAPCEKAYPSFLSWLGEKFACREWGEGDIGYYRQQQERTIRL